jgi:hypothetical protein
MKEARPSAEDLESEGKKKVKGSREEKRKRRV